MRNTRKALSLCLILCVVLCAAPLHAHAYAPEDIESSFGSGFSFLFDLASQTLLVRGTGDMPAFDSADSVPWQNIKPQIQTLILGDGITSISANAFADCTALRRLVLPAGVKSIAATAFAGCTNLKSIQTTGDVEALREMLKDAGPDVSRIHFTRISQAQFELLAANVKRSDAPGTRKAEDLSYVIIRYDFAKRPIYIEEMDSSGNKTVTEIEYLAQPEKGTDETVETRTVTVDPAEGAATFTGTDYNDAGRTQRRETGELDEQNRVALSTEYTYGDYGATSVRTLDSVTYAEDGSYTQVWTTRGDYQGENLFPYDDDDGGAYGDLGISNFITREIYEVGAQDQVLSIKTTQTNNGKVTAVSTQDFRYDGDGNQTMREWKLKVVEEGYYQDWIEESSGTDVHSYENGKRTATVSTCTQGEDEEVCRRTAYTYDENDQLIKAVTTDEDDPDWSITQEYEYNDNGSVSRYSYEDPDRTRNVEYSYDEQGLKTGKTDTEKKPYRWNPEVTVTTQTVTSYNEDERAASRTVTTTRGEVLVSSTEISFTYNGDVLTDSVSTRTNRLGDTTTTSQYNEMGLVTFEDTTTAYDGHSSQSYTYDKDGILLKSVETYEEDESSGETTYTFNADGRLKSYEDTEIWTWADGEIEVETYTVVCTYEDGLLTNRSQVDGWDDYTSSTSYTYDDEGRLLTRMIEHSDEDGVYFSKTEEYTYNPDGSGQIERSMVDYDWDFVEEAWVPEPAEVTEQQLDTDGCPVDTEYHALEIR